MSNKAHTQALIPVTTDELRWLMESGYLLLEMGRFDEARDVFEGTAALGTRSCLPWIGLGRVAAAQGREQEALECFETSIEIAGGGGEEAALARSALAEALFVAGREDEAKRRIREALSASPGGRAADYARQVLEGIKHRILSPDTTGDAS